MKKIVALVLVFIMLSVSALAAVTCEQLDVLSDADKIILKANVGIAIANKENGKDIEKYSYHLKMDLMELSIEELNWIYEYLNSGTNPKGDELQEETALSRHGIEIETSDEVFTTDERLVFCLYMTVAHVCDQLGLAVQTHNPEIFFQPEDQHLTQAFFYINYYANGKKEDLRIEVEEYTDVLLEAIQAAYPRLMIDKMVFCWQIPAIDKDSLYSAMFWCEKQGNVIVRGDGTGVAYQ